MKKEIIYSIDKKIDRYVLHKIIITETGMNIDVIYSGDREDCRKKLNKILEKRKK